MTSIYWHLGIGMWVLSECPVSTLPSQFMCCDLPGWPASASGHLASIIYIRSRFISPFRHNMSTPHWGAGHQEQLLSTHLGGWTLPMIWISKVPKQAMPCKTPILNSESNRSPYLWIYEETKVLLVNSSIPVQAEMLVVFDDVVWAYYCDI